MEESLRLAQNVAQTHSHQLEAVFESIADGMYVYDRDGKLIQTNTAAQAINPQTTDQQYLTTPFEERINSLELRDAHGQPLAVDDLPIRRVLRGETLRGERAMDTIMRQPNGHDLLLNTTGAPVRDAQGTAQGAVIVTRDVTERRRLECQTQEALTALAAIAESLVAPPADEAALRPTEGDAATQTATADGLFPAREVAHHLVELTIRMLGCARGSIVTVDARTDLLRPVVVVGLAAEEEQRWRAATAQTRLRNYLTPRLTRRLRAGETLVLDARRPPMDKLLHPYGVRALLMLPMRLGERLVGCLALDYGGAEHEPTPEELTLAGAAARLAALVVEREQLLREREEALANALALREANRRMDEFLGIASHELRTPLTILKANLQLAQRQAQRLTTETTQHNTEHAELRAQVKRLALLLERSAAASGR
ncbi:MAG: GAF domain-containing protein [Ktedonobacterales bacterium]